MLVFIVIVLTSGKLLPPRLPGELYLIKLDSVQESRSYIIKVEKDCFPVFARRGCVFAIIKPAGKVMLSLPDGKHQTKTRRNDFLLLN